MDEPFPRFRVVWSSIRFCRINEFEDEDAARAFAAAIVRRYAPPYEGPAVTVRVEDSLTTRPRMRHRIHESKDAPEPILARGDDLGAVT